MAPFALARFSTWRKAVAAVGLVTILAGAGMGQAAGASLAGSPTTTTEAATPGTTTPDPTVTSTTSTTTAAPLVAPSVGPRSPLPAATTTSTTIALPVYAGVSAPPRAVPVPADPEKMALAARLERSITAQSATLDLLAVSYSRAQSGAQEALQLTTATMGKLDESSARERAAQADTETARSALRNAAISAYLGVPPTPKITGGQFGPVYQAGLADAYSSNVVGSLGDRVQLFRAAQLRASGLQKAVEEAARKAHAAQASADADVAKVLAATQAATALQAKLSATLAIVKGDLVTLLAAQRAASAWQTYASLGGGQALDFVPAKPLPAQMPQTSAAIAVVTAQMDKPYLWGGAGPDSFDCSGLMQWSWNQLAVRLPRVAADQQAWATPVPISQVLPGDLVFFGSPAHHVGLYIGSGLMVDAPHAGAFVETVPIWWNELSGFGRVHS